MKRFLKAILIGIVVILVTIVVAKILFNTFSRWSILGSFIFGACVTTCVTIYLIARSRGERPKDVAKEVVEQVINPDPDALKHRVEEQLMRLNESLRLEGVKENVITASEKVIDLLLEVVPSALSKSPHSEATFNLEKLATDYFPDLIRNYLELSSEDQVTQEESLLKQIRELAETIRAAKASLDEGNLDEFQVSSSFLKAKTA